MHADNAALQQGPQPNERLAANRLAMQEALGEVRLSKKQIDRIVLRLKSLIRRVDKAEGEVRLLERPLGATGAALRRLVRDAKKSPERAVEVGEKLGVEPEWLHNLDRVIRSFGCGLNASKFSGQCIHDLISVHSHYHVKARQIAHRCDNWNHAPS